MSPDISSCVGGAFPTNAFDDDLHAAQNELREFAEYYIGRKPSIEDQTRKDHAGDKVAAVLKAGIQNPTFIEALVSKIARDLAFSEHEHHKIIDGAPPLIFSDSRATNSRRQINSRSFRPISSSASSNRMSG